MEPSEARKLMFRYLAWIIGIAFLLGYILIGGG